MASKRRRPICIGVSLGLSFLALTSCVTGPVKVDPEPMTFGAEFDQDLIEAGQDVVERECASCHALEQRSASRHPDAPPLNTLLSRYNAESLAEDFIAGVRVGHDDMPLFDFNVIAADAVIAYLQSISTQ